ncbi:MAG: sugar MFS transporter [Sphingopyxis sp.]|nr:sugar MFS transporter [Sphingopyxis sp.]
MAMTMGGEPQANVAGSESAPASVRWFVFLLFFLFGGITSLNDILIPKLKHLFVLSWTEAMLIQFVFFAAYFLVSIPAAALLRRLGYMRTAAAGLLTMMAACLLFIPASGSGLFVAFLAALFVLGAGITTVQVVANPLISMLGRAETSHSRLTFAQAFNSLGTTIFPFVGARLILGGLADTDPATLAPSDRAAFLAAETQAVVHAYLGIAALLFLVAAAIWTSRNILAEAEKGGGNARPSFGLLRQPRFALGTLGIFVYVGAEVAIASLLTNYLMDRRTLGIDAQAAGEMLVFYWGGAMIGRFLGAGLLRVVSPPLVLLGAALCAAGLVTLSILSSGQLAGYALLAVGLCNAIMFPTIFSLACEGLGERRADASGIICMAIVGGAIVPLLTGALADGVGLGGALLLPIACYAIIAAFARFCSVRPASFEGDNGNA